MRRVLVVEDSDLSRSFILLALQHRPDLEVLEARDGEEGWELLQSQPFDLVLTDLNMPGMSGLELVTKVRAAGGTLSEVPMVIITTEGEERALRDGAQVGANAYLCKPVRASDLNPILETYLAERVSRAPTREHINVLFLAAPGTARDRLADQLRETVPADVFEAATSLEALGQLFLREIHSLVIDMHTPHQQAEEFLSQLRSGTTYDGLPRVLLADGATRADMGELDNLGAAAVLAPDGPVQALCVAIRGDDA